MKLPGKLSMPVLIVLMCVSGSGAFGSPAISQEPTASAGFVANGEGVNTPPPNGSHPSIALGSLTPGGAQRPWVAFAKGDDLVVSRFDGTNWQQQGSALDFQTSDQADQPSIVFSGANNAMPWVAFKETIAGKGQIVASHFDGSVWHHDGSGSPPSLNHDTVQDAAHPRLASGTTQPWLTWDEATSSGRRVFVSTIQGNAVQPIGDAIAYNNTGNGTVPDIALAGTTPWVVWSEQAGNAANAIFAAQALADNGAPGGLRWSVVGQQANCASAATCALNLNASASATSPRITTGTLSDEATPAPWIVFVQQNSAGIGQLYVARLDGGRFRFVSGSLNVSQSSSASSPAIFFVGHVPHVTWSEQAGGIKRIFVRHLASAIVGQERWDLDSDDGLTRTTQNSIDPAIASDGNTAHIAWSEGNDLSTVFSARRFPDGPAWGRNYPPFIRIISGTIRLALNSSLPADKVLTAQQSGDVVGDPVEIVSTCNHADGWAAISEIQFKLSNEQETIFVGRYVAATNQVIMMNPNDLAGAPLGSGMPGSGPSIESDKVILHVSQMSIGSFGANAAALDVHWMLSFKQPTQFKQYTQSINIVYTTPLPAASAQATSETGFFRTGSLFVGNRIWLPVVKK